MDNSRKTGILLDSDTNDILIHGGAMVLGNTLYQNQYLLLTVKPGGFKANPLLGYSVDDNLGDENGDLLQQKRLREQLEMDLLTPSVLKVKDGEITLIADYV